MQTTPSLKGEIIFQMRRCTRLGWTTYGKQRYILRGSLHLCSDQCVFPFMANGLETRTLTKFLKIKLRSVQCGMEGSVLGIILVDKKTVSETDRRPSYNT